jgi:hypothetical protein
MCILYIIQKTFRANTKVSNNAKGRPDFLLREVGLVEVGCAISF